ncbi:hemerythrin-like metal-binding protein [Methanosphaerula palustris E1-9c]|uniref:Hemerythrin-like metal-binding protein n=2 Tax=Methanosphaerula palustris TaxID=475088 RepID=B8GH30_METPE|nr:hemerythrin-like metal-binding protein [Methanosphaerula palustris E1-9c]
MPIMDWTDDLSVGVTEIDNQHKRLIELINKLHDAMKAGQGKQMLETTLQELAAYTVYHFQAEEKYMVEYNYPRYHAHKIEHDAFVKKVTDFQKDFVDNRLGLTLDLMKFLKDWVNNHIKSTDKQYTALFNKSGLV